MAQVQSQTAVSPIPGARTGAIALALALVAAVIIAAALLASGLIGHPSSRAGEFGSSEWNAFRAGERGALVGGDLQLTPASVEFRRGEREAATSE